MSMSSTISRDHSSLDGTHACAEFFQVCELGLSEVRTSVRLAIAPELTPSSIDSPGYSDGICGMFMTAFRAASVPQLLLMI